MSRLRFLSIVAGATLVVVLLASTAVVLWGVYYRHWEGPVVTRIAEQLPIPAAKVGNRTVLLRNYFRDVRSVEQFLSSEAATADNQKRAIEENDKKMVLDRLIQEAAVAEIAEARNVHVTPEQETSVMEELQVTATSTPEFLTYIEKNYGWTLDEFKSHVVHPVILTRLLSASFAADHQGDTNAFMQYMEERTKRSDVVWYIKF